MAAVIQSEPDGCAVALPAERVTPVARSKRPAETLSQHLLIYSFFAAVLLAMAGFCVMAIYLFRYLDHAFAAFDDDAMRNFAVMEPVHLQDILLARAGLWKFILQSCGIICGAAFGFLGFALFLIGVKGDMDASYDDSQHKVQLSRMAPGTFVILMASILVALCSTTKVDLIFGAVESGQTAEPDIALEGKGSPSASTKPSGPEGSADPNFAEFHQAFGASPSHAEPPAHPAVPQVSKPK
jgi:hypothetical protein